MLLRGKRRRKGTGGRKGRKAREEGTEGQAARPGVCCFPGQAGPVLFLYYYYYDRGLFGPGPRRSLAVAASDVVRISSYLYYMMFLFLICFMVPVVGESRSKKG